MNTTPNQFTMSCPATSFAIAICTRNRPAELTRCLESVVAAPQVTQVLVAVDDVERATDEVIAAFQARDDRVELVRGPRLGLAANRNACIEACVADYLMFLDDDAELNPEFLSAVLPHAAPNKIVTGWELRAGYAVRRAGIDWLGFQRKRTGKALDSSLVINASVFPVSFLRRRPFDEYFEFGSEEVDIALAAVNCGLQIVEVDAWNTHHHVDVARTGNFRRARRSRLYLLLRLHGAIRRNYGALVVCFLGASAHAVLSGVRRGGARGLGAAIYDVLHAIDAAASARSPSPIPAPSRIPVASELSVVVPTYHRPDALRRCLEGIAAQTHPASEVVVVVRAEDCNSIDVVQNCFPLFGARLKTALSNKPGQVAALMVGAAEATSPIVAFVDDDAVPRTDWLQRIAEAFADEETAAVGGRDVLHSENSGKQRPRTRVGVLTWYGKQIGNHHLGVGQSRDVDVLKGANMSFRTHAYATPIGLKGNGAEVANDTASSLFASKFGKVRYDPRILVDHYPGPRYDADQRGKLRQRQGIADAVFNQTLAIAALRPALARRRWMYVLLVGDRSSPGILRRVVAAARGERLESLSYWSVVATVSQAVHDAKRGRLIMQEVPRQTQPAPYA